MVLIVSDYHRREDALIKLIDNYKPDIILCLGDGESEDYFYQLHNITSVKGNCDFADLPVVRNINFKGIKICMTHGHKYQAYFGIDRLYYLAKENEASYMFYGHTHIQRLEIVDGITFLNPGSLLDDNYALMDDFGNITLK